MSYCSQRKLWTGRYPLNALSRNTKIEQCSSSLIHVRVINIIPNSLEIQPGEHSTHAMLVQQYSIPPLSPFSAASGLCECLSQCVFSSSSSFCDPFVLWKTSFSLWPDKSAALSKTSTHFLWPVWVVLFVHAQNKLDQQLCKAGHSMLAFRDKNTFR